MDLLWRDFYELGVDFIDEDHKRLLHVMQDVGDAVSRVDREESGRLLSLSLAEAKSHFAREEEFLAKVGWPGLEDHKNYHRQLKLMQQAIQAKRICEGIETEHDLQECFGGMARFLVDDVLRGYILFKSYLEYEGIIERKLRPH
jgi:hemerythrin-like metal-binding protein